MQGVTVVDGDTTSCEAAPRVTHVSMGHVHDDGHIERAMTDRGPGTQLLEVDMSSNRHLEEEHVSRHCADKGDISDLATVTRHQERVGRAASIIWEVVDLDRFSHSQLGPTARRPDLLRLQD